MVWITRKEVPTSSSCRATGRPSLSSSAMMRPSKRTLRREKWKGSRSFRRWMTARGDHHADRLGGHRGQGRPGRAQVKALHQQQVAPMLITQASITVNSGVRASPMPRNTAPARCRPR